MHLTHTNTPRLRLPLDTVWQSDHEERAKRVLAEAEQIDCAKFVRPRDIVKGNRKLNLAFVANLFNMFPALESTDIEVPDDDDIEETREEKSTWLQVHACVIILPPPSFLLVVHTCCCCHDCFL